MPESNAIAVVRLPALQLRHLNDVAARVVQLGDLGAGDSNPRLRYLIGQQAKTVARLRRFLPARLYEQGVRRTFSLDSTAPAAASSTRTRS
jgi:hypothetical protein